MLRVFTYSHEELRLLGFIHEKRVEEVYNRFSVNILLELEEWFEKCQSFKELQEKVKTKLKELKKELKID